LSSRRAGNVSICSCVLDPYQAIECIRYLTAAGVGQSSLCSAILILLKLIWLCLQ